MGASGAILMRLFGSRPLKFPPPALCLHSPAHSRRQGVDRYFVRREESGGRTDERGGGERMRNKGIEVKSNV